MSIGIDPFSGGWEEIKNNVLLGGIITGSAQAIKYGSAYIADVVGVGETTPTPQIINYGYGPSVPQTKTKPKRKKMKYKRQKLATVTAVKRMIGAVEEKKNFSGSTNTTFATISNGLVHSQNITALITQGTTTGTRIGDEVYLTKLEMFFVFYAPAVSSVQRFRVMIVWSGEEVSTAGMSTSNLGATDIFLPGYTDIPSALVNPKACTVLFDTNITINSQQNGFKDGHVLRHVCKLTQKFKYQTGGSAYGKVKNLYFVVVPTYNSTGSPADAGVCLGNFAVHYTDS